MVRVRVQTAIMQEALRVLPFGMLEVDTRTDANTAVLKLKLVSSNTL